MRALVVDDSRPMRRVESAILAEIGFETFEAVDGRDALNKLEAGHVPELMLVDWNMPELDGLGLIKALRKDDRFEKVVVLMVTTETEPEQMLRALSAGADEYLMKPFQKEALLDKLRLLGVVAA